MTRQAIAVWEDEFAKKLDVDIFANSPDFDPPIYNVWKQQNRSDKAFALWLACHTQEEIADAVEVDKATVSRWCDDLLQSLANEDCNKWTDFDPPIYNVWKQQNRSDKAFALWLACHTQEEIAAAVGVPQQTIAGWMKDFTEKLAADNSVKWTDFDHPIYNVWKQQNKRIGMGR